MKSIGSGSTNTLTHTHTHAHTPHHHPHHPPTLEPGLVLIGDVWFANLREERKEGKDQGAREKARQAARKALRFSEELSFSIPPSRIRSSSLLGCALLPLARSVAPRLRSSSESAELRQPGQVEGKMCCRITVRSFPTPSTFQSPFLS